MWSSVCIALFEVKSSFFKKSFCSFAVSDQLLADGEVKKPRVPLNIDTNMLKIGFLGGGKMAQALAKGFIRAGELFLPGSS